MIIIINFNTKAADLDDLKGLVKQWLDLRKERVDAVLQWQQEKAMLLVEIELLESKVKSLEAKIKLENNKKRKNSGTKDKLASDLKTRQTLFNEIKNYVESAEKEVVNWQKRLPSFLNKQLEPGFKKLEQNKSNAPGDLAIRLQLIYSLKHQLAQMDQIIHHGKMLIKVDGKEELMEVITLGLSMAFAVNESNTKAVTASFAKDTLSWNANASIAQSVRDVLIAFKNPQSAKFTALPFVLEDKK